MAEFSTVGSFDIDNGELDGLSSQKCFVLGYELAHICSILERGRAVARPVHALNEARIAKLCAATDREFRLEWMADDRSETWMWLSVAPLTAAGLED